MLVLGVVPSALVTYYYDALPRRLVIQWDSFGNTTLIGTRASTVLAIALVAAVVALAAIAISVWQHRALVTLDMRRAFFGLNFGQIIAINLTCAMIVGDALGFALTIKPAIPPAMAVALFAAGILCLRIDRAQRHAFARVMGIALALGAVALLAFAAIAANEAIGYYASAFATLAMTAIALPQTRD